MSVVRRSLGSLKCGSELPLLVVPELRWDPLTGRPVIIAEDRSFRPNEYRSGAPPEDASESCPFCEGHEGRTPPELAALRTATSSADGPGWTVRVFENKFPTLSRTPRTGSPISAEPSRSSPPGSGAHEVIVESPSHSPLLPGLPTEQVRRVLQVVRERVRHHAHDPEIEAITVFENVGPESGGTLWHPHAQLIAASFVPPRLREELELSAAPDSSQPCRLEAAVADDRTDARRPIAESPAFSVACPFASEHPYAARIAPIRHAASFGDAADGELDELALALPRLLRSLLRVVPAASYNWWILSLPTHARSPRYHWHLDLAPRLVRADAFEIGTGVAVNPVPPAVAGPRLRAAWESDPGPSSAR